MPIRFTCSGCGKAVSTNEVNAGQMVRCKCGQILTVPSVASEEERDTYEVAPRPVEMPAQPSPEDPEFGQSALMAKQAASRRAAEKVSKPAAFSLKMGKWSLKILLWGIGLSILFIGLAYVSKMNPVVLMLAGLSKFLVELAWGVFAVTAIVSGIIGLISVAVSRGERTGTGKALSGITLAGVPLILALIVAFIVMPAVALAREAAACAECQARLQKIGKGIVAYETDNHRTLYSPGGPLASLALLYPKYVSDPEVFVCPSAHLDKTPTFPQGTPLAGRPCSYEYILKERAGKGWREEVILKDWAFNHPHTVNVLHADCSTETQDHEGNRLFAGPSTQPEEYGVTPSEVARQPSGQSETPAASRPTSVPAVPTQPWGPPPAHQPEARVTTAPPASVPPTVSSTPATTASPPPTQPSGTSSTTNTTNTTTSWAPPVHQPETRATSTPSTTTVPAPPRTTASTPPAKSTPTRPTTATTARPKAPVATPPATTHSRPSATSTGLSAPNSATTPARTLPPRKEGEPRIVVEWLPPYFTSSIPKGVAALRVQFAAVDVSARSTKIDLGQVPPFGYELANERGIFLKAIPERGPGNVPTKRILSPDLVGGGARSSSWVYENRFGAGYQSIPAGTYTFRLNVPGFKPVVLKPFVLKSQVSSTISFVIECPGPQFPVAATEGHEPWPAVGPLPLPTPKVRPSSTGGGPREQPPGEGTLEFDFLAMVRTRGIDIELGSYRVLDARGNVVQAKGGPLAGKIVAPGDRKSSTPISLVLTGVPPGTYNAIIEINGAKPYALRDLTVREGSFRKTTLLLTNVPWANDDLPELVTEGE